MSGRGDIAPNRHGWRRLSYTCRCGWVDWGHALPGSALELKGQMDSERGAWPGLETLDVTFKGEPAFIIWYGQQMGSATLNIYASAARQWVVHKGLSRADRESAALGIFLHASHEFESMQSSFPFSMITDSGFSPEDLVSNVIGFYRAYRGIDHERMRQICGEVPVAESERIWDEHLPNGLSALKNRTTQPIRFPSEMCTDTTFPPLLESIPPQSRGRNWQVLTTRHLPAGLVYGGQPIEISAGGEASLRGH